MRKTRVSLMILGAILIAVASMLTTYFTLMSTGVINSGDNRISLVVQIEDTEKEYDGTALMADSYTITSGKVETGATLDVTYLGSQTDVGESEATAEIKVLDNDGFEITSKYKISVTKGKLSVTKRKVTLQVTDEQKVYDGTPLTGEEFTIQEGSIIPGHQVVPNFQSSLTEVGQTKSLMVAEIYDALGNNLTNNYEISYLDGALEIKKAPLTLKTLSLSKVYDGTPLVPNLENGYEITQGELPKDYSISFTYTNDSYITDVTTSISKSYIDNSTIVIKDGNGIDVTNNYQILLQNVGVLSISPYTLYLNHDNYKTTYDGYLHENKEFTLKNSNLEVMNISSNTFTLFGTTFSLKVNSASSLTNAGEVLNEIDLGIYLYGEDVTSNFNIEANEAYLTVEKANLTIYGKTIQQAYTGNKVSFALETEYDTNLTQGLAETDVLEVEYNPNTSITEVGNVDIDIINKEILHYSSSMHTGTSYSAIHNYEITIIPGNIEIYKTTLKITGRDLFGVYTGSPQSSDGTPEKISEDGITATLSYDSFTEAQEGTENTFTVLTITDINGNDVLNNYEITKEYGTVTIQKKEISVGFMDVTEDFQGNELSIADSTTYIANGSLVTNHSIKFYNVTDATKILSYSELISGKYTKEAKVDISDIYIVDLKGNDVTNNYSISKYNSTIDLTINAGSSLQIEGKGTTKYYDETGLTAVTYKDSIYTPEFELYTKNSNLPDGFTLAINYADLYTLNGTPLNSSMVTDAKAGDYEIPLYGTKSGTSYNSIHVYYGDYDLTGLFILSITNPVFTISKKSIDISIQNQYTTYNEDFTLDVDAFTNNEKTLVNTLGIALDTPYTKGDDAGYYTISLDIPTEVEENYNITSSLGVLTVEKKNASIQIKNQSGVYSDFTGIDITSYTSTDAALVPSLITEWSTGDDAGTYTIYAEEFDSTIQKNYNIQINTGILTIEKKNVSIQVKNQSGIYSDFTGIDTASYTTSDTNVTPSLETDWTDSSDAGTYTIYAADFDSTIQKNYNIQINTGILTIEKKNAYIQIEDQSFTYGNSFAIDPNAYTVTDDLFNVTLTTSWTSTSNAGTYVISTSLDSTIEKNYNATITNGTLTVYKKNAYIQIYNQSYTYGDAFTFDTGAYTSSDTSLLPSLETTWTAGADAGSYLITATFDDTTMMNYNLSISTATLTVGKKNITVRMDNQSYTYGDTFSLNVSAYTVTDSAFSVSLSTTWTSTSNCGTYPITAIIDEAYYTNYSITLVEGSLEVLKKDVTIMLQNQSGIYSDFTAINTNAYTTTVATITPDLATDWTSTSDAGTYTIYAEEFTSDIYKNYNIQINTATLTIEKKSTVVTIHNQYTVYGEAFTFDDQAYESQDIVPDALYTNYTAGADAGTYTIYAEFSSFDLVNYDVVVNTGILTVEKAQVEVSIHNQNGTYSNFTTANLDLTAYSLSYSTGVDPTDLTITLDTNYTDGDDAGTYTIYGAVDAANYKNYNITISNGTLTISKLSVYATIKDQTITAGSSFATTGTTAYTITEDIAGLVVTSDADTTVAGTYTLYFDFSSCDLTNYDLHVVSTGTLTIN